MTNKVFYTNEQMVAALDSIHRAMHIDLVKPDVVYGITRGGLIPAVYSSHYFDVPMNTIKVTTYDDQHFGSVEEIIADLKNGKTVFLVDDICDTGNTLRYIIGEIQANDDSEDENTPSLLDSLYIATLIHNEACDIEPDYAGMTINKVENPCWIVFPWER